MKFGVKKRRCVSRFSCEDELHKNTCPDDLSVRTSFASQSCCTTCHSQCAYRKVKQHHKLSVTRRKMHLAVRKRKVPLCTAAFSAQNMNSFTPVILWSLLTCFEYFGPHFLLRKRSIFLQKTTSVMQFWKTELYSNKLYGLEELHSFI